LNTPDSANALSDQEIVQVVDDTFDPLISGHPLL
jgi:hypothetical protein